MSSHPFFSDPGKSGSYKEGYEKGYREGLQAGLEQGKRMLNAYLKWFEQQKPHIENVVDENKINTT